MLVFGVLGTHEGRGRHTAVVQDAAVAKICFKPCIATKWGGGAAMLPFWVVGQINLLNLSKHISLNF